MPPGPKVATRRGRENRTDAHYQREDSSEYTPFDPGSHELRSYGNTEAVKGMIPTSRAQVPAIRTASETEK